MDDLLVARGAAAAGADVLTSLFGQHHRPDYKGPIDPVTAADKAAEDAVLGHIRNARPEDSILSEEGGGGGAGDNGRTWIVDPMDGTVNFINHIPHIAVSVALWDGPTPLVGVIHDVLRDEVFSAAAGRGADCNGEQARVSAKRELTRAIVATGYPYDHQDHADAYASATAGVLAKVQGIRRFGSAALDLAWTAVGRYDGYFELGVAPWDIAAGLLIMREAGGIATDPFGNEASWDTPLIVTANPNLHEELRLTVVERIPEHLK